MKIFLSPSTLDRSRVGFDFDLILILTLTLTLTLFFFSLISFRFVLFASCFVTFTQLRTRVLLLPDSDPR